MVGKDMAVAAEPGRDISYRLADLALAAGSAVAIRDLVRHAVGGEREFANCDFYLTFSRWCSPIQIINLLSRKVGCGS